MLPQKREPHTWEMLSPRGIRKINVCSQGDPTSHTWAGKKWSHLTSSATSERNQHWWVIRTLHPHFLLYFNLISICNMPFSPMCKNYMHLHLETWNHWAGLPTKAEDELEICFEHLVSFQWHKDPISAYEEKCAESQLLHCAQDKRKKGNYQALYGLKKRKPCFSENRYLLNLPTW